MKFANPPPLISKLLNDLHTNTDIEREQALLLLARFAESCSPGITARDPPSQAFLESQFLHHQKNINWGDDEEGILPDRRHAAHLSSSAYPTLTEATLRNPNALSAELHTFG
ncbi:hypothetical protein RQP46_001066 [Phenoliferia psychrophenolica]